MTGVAIPMLPPRRSSVIASIAPTNLGEPLDAKQIRAEFFKDRVSIDYVLEHVAPDRKFYMGREAVWYRAEVEAWMPIYVKEQQERAKRRRRKA